MNNKIDNNENSDVFEMKTASENTDDKILDIEAIYLFFLKRKTFFIKLFVFIILIMVFIFPQVTAGIISDWVNDFIGTLTKNINL